MLCFTPLEIVQQCGKMERNYFRQQGDVVYTLHDGKSMRNHSFGKSDIVLLVFNWLSLTFVMAQHTCKIYPFMCKFTNFFVSSEWEPFCPLGFL